MAEEIVVEKKERKLNQETPFTKIDKSSSEDEPDSTVDPHKAQKKLLKKEKREKRRLKKELKLAF